MNTLSSVTRTLQVSLAAPHMLAALEQVLPLIQKAAQDLITLAHVTESSADFHEAALYAQAAMHVEHAIKKACPPEPLPQRQVLQMPGRVQ